MVEWEAVAAIGGAVGGAIGVLGFGVAIWSARSSRRSADAAEESAKAASAAAESAATAARIETDRRHDEIRPALTYALVVDNGKAGSTRPLPGARATLTITLDGPADLAGLAVAIRDDRDRAPGVEGGPTAQDIAATIWGPWRFVRGVDGAASDGRTVPARPLARRHELVFALEPTPAPHWMEPDTWAGDYAKAPLRLTVTCTRPGHEPWILAEDVEPSPKNRMMVF